MSRQSKNVLGTLMKRSHTSENRPYGGRKWKIKGLQSASGRPSGLKPDYLVLLGLIYTKVK